MVLGKILFGQRSAISTSLFNSPLVPDLLGVAQAPEMQLNLLVAFQFHGCLEREEDWEPAEHSCKKKGQL
jgi:hypothetical protein